jgi:hypothetical protein
MSLLIRANSFVEQNTASVPVPTATPLGDITSVNFLTNRHAKSKVGTAKHEDVFVFLYIGIPEIADFTSTNYSILIV